MSQVLWLKLTDWYAFTLFSVSGYSGTAGDGFGVEFPGNYYDLNNMMFSTKDKDNDNYGTGCAELFVGAWWYNECGYANLNSAFPTGTSGQCEMPNSNQCMHWMLATNPDPLSRAIMKIAPIATWTGRFGAADKIIASKIIAKRCNHIV